MNVFSGGSGIRVQGFNLNNQLLDFTKPSNSVLPGNIRQSKANHIEPGKRSMSSACPTIYTDKNGDVVSVVAAAGGMQIISSVNSVCFQI